MTQLDPVIIVGMVLIIAVTYVLLRRYFVMPYLQVLEGRERLYELSDSRTDEAEESVKVAQQHAEDVVSEAAEQAEKIRSDARATADEYRTQCVGEATALATASLEKGRERIAKERAGELEKLREQARECVGLACERLLGNADAETVGSAVERALARHGG
jgi:F0F1-type ATP synthase membrane subunit b/b'